MSCLAGVPPIRVPDICPTDRAASYGTASLLHVHFVSAPAGAYVLGEGRQRPSSEQAHAGTKALPQCHIGHELFTDFKASSQSQGSSVQ